ncbi:MAG: peptidoglycan DD-metalloendopeptidase family protein [Firmicutes bacterium]|nr:peptidoglycan DD-metalloendopeptidase family protein [Bacillota bacterium]
MHRKGKGFYRVAGLLIALLAVVTLGSGRMEDPERTAREHVATSISDISVTGIAVATSVSMAAASMVPSVPPPARGEMLRPVRSLGRGDRAGSIPVTVVAAQTVPAQTVAAPSPAKAEAAETSAGSPSKTVAAIAAATPANNRPAGAGGDLLYTVRPGDTLGSISSRFDVSVKELAANNGIRNLNVIKVGQRLVIRREGIVHTVRWGDTVWDLARKYGITTGQIVSANKLSDPTRLSVGRKLLIPVGAGGDRPEEGSGDFVWPLVGRMTSGFGQRWGRLHEGIDLAAPTGTVIRAARSGVVVRTGWWGTYGNVIEIDHGNGVSTLYAHNSRNLVAIGQRVSTGDAVARVGSTGNSTGPHVHFEIRIDGRPRDPIRYLP